MPISGSVIYEDAGDGGLVPLCVTHRFLIVAASRDGETNEAFATRLRLALGAGQVEITFEGKSASIAVTAENYTLRAAVLSAVEGVERIGGRIERVGRGSH